MFPKYFMFILGLNLISKALGYTRELGLAWIWGVGSDVDLFLLLMLFPALIVDFTIMYANGYLTPKYKKNRNNEILAAASIYLNIINTIMTLVFFLGLFFFKNYITNDNLFELSIAIVLVSFLWGNVELLKIILIAEKKQIQYSYSIIMGNITIILIFIMYSNDTPIIFMPIALIMSYVMQYVYIRFRLFKNKIYFIYTKNTFIEFNTMVKNTWLYLYSTFINQFYKNSEKVIAYKIGFGSLSLYYYSGLVYSLVINIFVVTFLNYIYPKIFEENNIQFDLRTILDFNVNLKLDAFKKLFSEKTIRMAI